MGGEGYRVERDHENGYYELKKYKNYLKYRLYINVPELIKYAQNYWKVSI